MAFTIQTDYAAGDTLDASQIDANFTALRRSTHVAALSNFDSRELQARHIFRPDVFWSSNSTGKVVYPSGGILWRQSSEEADDIEYTTCHVKQSNFKSRVLYTDLGNASFRFFPERACFAKLRVWINGVGQTNTVLSNSGDSNSVYISQDDSIQTETLTYVGDNGAVIAGSPARVGNAQNRWTPIALLWAGSLSAVPVNFSVVCDSLLELASYRSYSMQLTWSYYT